MTAYVTDSIVSFAYSAVLGTGVDLPALLCHRNGPSEENENKYYLDIGSVLWIRNANLMFTVWKPRTPNSIIRNVQVWKSMQFLNCAEIFFNKNLNSWNLYLFHPFSSQPRFSVIDAREFPYRSRKVFVWHKRAGNCCYSQENNKFLSCFCSFMTGRQNAPLKKKKIYTHQISSASSCEKNHFIWEKKIELNVKSLKKCMYRFTWFLDRPGLGDVVLL